MIKTLHLLTLSVLAIAPAMLFAHDTDHQIDDAAKSSYNFRVVLDNNVKAHSDDGVVTLTGTVDDKRQRDLAEDTVKNLPGVTGVNNEIEVRSGESREHSDSWIALKIKSLLLVRANVSASHTKVDVHDGVVTLTGTAENEAQKDLTASYAQSVDNVRAVHNELVVENPPRGENDRSVGDVVDDASITTQVKYALLDHKGTSAFATKVKTKDGVVRVWGEASSDAQKDLVTRLAQSVRGVRTVDNEMTVRTD